ncbi:hypothetical protein FQN57_006664 [Myotisia sp. PD_48]|nr:hypothetical protein FQN57_006664 [Myotisia sp. PD_48]
MTRADRHDVRSSESTKYDEEEAHSLLSGPSTDADEEDYLVVDESSEVDSTPESSSKSPPAQAQTKSQRPLNLRPSLSQSPNGQPRTQRTPNRVRFDLEDDIQSETDRAWIADEDFLDEEHASVRRSSTSQRAPLLTDIEAPSVTVATSGLDFLPEDHLESARPRSGLRSAFMNMANSIIGAGIIGQPYAFRQAGMTMGIILLVMLTAIVDWTIRLIVLNSKLSGADSFQTTVESCFGRPGLIAISLAQWLFAFGGMVAFNIIVGDTIPHVLIAIFPKLHDMPVLWLLTDRRAVIVIFVLGISYPLSLYRDIAKLAKASTFALVSMVVIVITVVVQGTLVSSDLKGSIKGDLFVNSGVIQAIGVISFAFVCHHNSLLIYGSLKKPTMDRFALVTHYSTGISMGMCLTMALAGFFTFGSKTKGNILNNFPPDNIMVNIARLFFGLNMLTTLPLEAFVCREVMTTFYFPDEPYNLNRHLIFTSSLVVTSVILSLLTCDLGHALELIGATSASVLAYILPPLCYIKLSKSHWVTKIPAVLCIAFGTVVLCTSVVQSAIKIIHLQFQHISYTKMDQNDLDSVRENRMKALQMVGFSLAIFALARLGVDRLIWNAFSKKADLGTARREHISTVDLPNKYHCTTRAELEASRASNIAGTDSHKLAEQNKSKLGAWNDAWKTIGGDNEGESLNPLMDGQTHRAQLSRVIANNPAATVSKIRKAGRRDVLSGRGPGDQSRKLSMVSQLIGSPVAPAKVKGGAQHQPNKNTPQTRSATAQNKTINTRTDPRRLSPVRQFLDPAKDCNDPNTPGGSSSKKKRRGRGRANIEEITKPRRPIPATQPGVNYEDLLADMSTFMAAVPPMGPLSVPTVMQTSIAPAEPTANDRDLDTSKRGISVEKENKAKTGKNEIPTIPNKKTVVNTPTLQEKPVVPNPTTSIPGPSKLSINVFTSPPANDGNHVAETKAQKTNHGFGRCPPLPQPASSSHRPSTLAQKKPSKAQKAAEVPQGKGKSQPSILDIDDQLPAPRLPEKRPRIELTSPEEEIEKITQVLSDLSLLSPYAIEYFKWRKKSLEEQLAAKSALATQAKLAQQTSPANVITTSSSSSSAKGGGPAAKLASHQESGTVRRNPNSVVYEGNRAENLTSSQQSITRLADMPKAKSIFEQPTPVPDPTQNLFAHLIKRDDKERNPDGIGEHLLPGRGFSAPAISGFAAHTKEHSSSPQAQDIKTEHMFSAAPVTVAPISVLYSTPPVAVSPTPSAPAKQALGSGYQFSPAVVVNPTSTLPVKQAIGSGHQFTPAVITAPATVQPLRKSRLPMSEVPNCPISAATMQYCAGNLPQVNAPSTRASPSFQDENRNPQSGSSYSTRTPAGNEFKERYSAFHARTSSLSPVAPAFQPTTSAPGRDVSYAQGGYHSRLASNASSSAEQPRTAFVTAMAKHGVTVNAPTDTPANKPTGIRASKYAHDDY